MREKLTYVEERKIKVYVGSKHVGNIKPISHKDGTIGWCYFAKGARKQSLEAD